MDSTLRCTLDSSALKPPGMELVYSFAHRTGADFSALYAVERYAKDHDLALGRLAGGSPIGVMRGRDQHEISKWRNMTKAEQASLDGRILWTGGGPRDGRATLYMRPDRSGPPASGEATPEARKEKAQ